MSELNKHSGSKYQKIIRAIPGTGQLPILVDVYCVIEAFDVQRNPIAHAIKKLLMAGKRGGKDEIQDYEEAIDAIRRGIEQAVVEKADTDQPEPKMSRFPVTFEDLLNSKRTAEPPKQASQSGWLMCQCDLCQQRRKIETAIFGQPIDWDGKYPYSNTPPKQGELPNEHV